LSQSVCPIYARRIDPDLFTIAIHPTTGEVFLSGADKLLKKYKQPDDIYLKTQEIKFKIGAAPLEEFDGQALPVNIMKSSEEFNWLACGSRDGTIRLRDLDNPGQFVNIPAQNILHRGVSALEFSNKGRLVYSGGYDGSLFLWRVEEGAFEFGNQPLPESYSSL